MSDGPIYQLKVTLMDTMPPIWRRIQVPAAMPLRKLHRVLQVVMGWTNSHLYMYKAGKVMFGHPSSEDMVPMVNDQKVAIEEVLNAEKDAIIYEYDFGDSWEHELFLEKVLDPDPSARLPACLAGARACPPEDCGGTGGYEDLLAVMKDPKHPEREDMKVWVESMVPAPFDPERFDLAETNRELRSVR